MATEIQHKAGETLAEFLLAEPLPPGKATSSLSVTLTELSVAAKLISRQVKQAGLAEARRGFPGGVQPLGAGVAAVERFAREVLVNRLTGGAPLGILAAEGMSDPSILNLPPGESGHDLILDPLCGSSELECNISPGTIFGLYPREGGREAHPEDLFRPGKEMTAAGYFVYGSTTMLVLSLGRGVHGFTLEPSLGEFLLSLPQVTIPSTGYIYSANEARAEHWPAAVSDLLEHLKNPGERGAGHSLRHTGALVADFHRILLLGGLLMRPSGDRFIPGESAGVKLVFQAAPLAWVAGRAGGRASDGRGPILNRLAGDLQEKVPLFIGSAQDVALAERFLQHKGAA